MPSLINLHRGDLPLRPPKQPINTTQRIADMRPSFEQLGKILALQAEAGVLSTVPALATEAEELIAALEAQLGKSGASVGKSSDPK